MSRSQLLEALDREVETAASMACLYLDLDHLKPFNACLGHELGDLALRTVAERLADYVGPGALLARFGGDEFVVVHPSWNEAEARAHAFRISQEIVRRPINQLDSPYPLSEDEFGLLMSHWIPGIRFFGPFEDGNYAFAALRGPDRPPAAQVEPFKGMPLNAAYISATIGVSYLRAPDLSSQELVQKADVAMYEQKGRRPSR